MTSAKSFVYPGRQHLYLVEGWFTNMKHHWGLTAPSRMQVFSAAVESGTQLLQPEEVLREEYERAQFDAAFDEWAQRRAVEIGREIWRDEHLYYPSAPPASLDFETLRKERPLFAAALANMPDFR